MKYLLLCYPRCTTCTKARKWLDENNIEYEERNIKENNPTEDELRQWIIKSNYPIKKFFNTSGNVYKELKLKDKLSDMNDDEKINILSTDGMLVKRPIIVGEKYVFVGFKEDEWKNILE
ncbi:arsenate reductase family protein [Tissierella pigra]|uniref:Arsenate reductase family protein n=1 Tax=Tissierella pigra TaxID=2607614 RepID=A0A6N7XJW2_9FIRM|nr:arsenate reductase family protein [Tissierella pigra]MBU5425471.1 arsenate reductase family protein [Tissierella pigra]MSU01072.1 arsenate reductase family protein [Tissierella pigra]